MILAVYSSPSPSAVTCHSPQDASNANAHPSLPALVQVGQPICIIALRDSKVGRVPLQAEIISSSPGILGWATHVKVERIVKVDTGGHGRCARVVGSIGSQGLDEVFIHGMAVRIVRVRHHTVVRVIELL